MVKIKFFIDFLKINGQKYSFEEFTEMIDKYQKERFEKDNMRGS